MPAPASKETPEAAAREPEAALDLPPEAYSQCSQFSQQTQARPTSASSEHRPCANARSACETSGSSCNVSRCAEPVAVHPGALRLPQPAPKPDFSRRLRGLEQDLEQARALRMKLPPSLAQRIRRLPIRTGLLKEVQDSDEPVSLDVMECRLAEPSKRPSNTSRNLKDASDGGADDATISRSVSASALDLRIALEKEVRAPLRDLQHLLEQVKAGQESLQRLFQRSQAATSFCQELHAGPTLWSQFAPELRPSVEQQGTPATAEVQGLVAQGKTPVAPPELSAGPSRDGWPAQSPDLAASPELWGQPVSGTAHPRDNGAETLAPLPQDAESNGWSKDKVALRTGHALQPLQPS